MSADTIVSLIETRLQTWAELQDLQVAFEGVSFKPPAGTYVQSRHLPASTVGAFLDGQHKAFTGLWQVSIVCVKGRGTGEGRRLGDSLSDYFPQNLILASGSFSLVTTTPVSFGPWVDDPPGAKTARTSLPCSFQYRADVVS